MCVCVFVLVVYMRVNSCVFVMCVVLGKYPTSPDVQSSLKRKAVHIIPYTQEEQHQVLKRLRQPMEQKYVDTVCMKCMYVWMDDVCTVCMYVLMDG